MECIECGSPHVRKNGYFETVSGLKQRYKCTGCGKSFSELVQNDPDIFDDEFDDETAGTPEYSRSDEWLNKNIYSKKTVVITAAQNNTSVDEGFYRALETYVDERDAAFVAIPIKYKTVNASDDLFADSYDERLDDYLVENTLTWERYNVKVYAGIKIQATAENPLSGLDPLSKGYSVIVGHAQVQLKMLPNLNKRIADIITSTGAITTKNYSKTKLGEKARFNHSLSAVVLEFDDDYYHIRHLNYDPVTESFCDLNKQYFASGEIDTTEVEALVTGDEHILFRDEVVEKLTYSNKDSLVNVLRPRYIVRHDVLDSYSISHHHRKNVFTTFAKFKSGFNDIGQELNEAIGYINSTTPEWSKSLIVQSNHNEHLLRWLNEVDIKTEPWNALIYHYLMYNMLLQTDMSHSGTRHPDPFKLIADDWLASNVEFVDRQGFEILGIEIGNHGDYGVNGARGSAKSFARMPNKTITGHSHSPAIEKGAYVVGTSSRLSLEYNKGASTWHHAHCIIHKNGKRQLVFLTPDGWCL